MNGAAVEQEDVVDGCVRFGDFIFNNNCKSWLRTYTHALKILGENPKDTWDESDVVDAVMRAIEVGSEQPDKKRLAWLISYGAYVARATDGEVYWVMMKPDEESRFECVNKSPCYTAEEAIDDAMRIEATKP